MKPRLPGLYMRGPSRKVRDSSRRAIHGKAAAAYEASTATKTAAMEAATTTEVTASAAKTATMEAATTEVTATATKAATMASATTAKSTATATSSAAVPSRPRWVTEEGKQTEANNAKYSFCFHILSSRQPRVPAMARPPDFRILPKTD